MSLIRKLPSQIQTNLIFSKVDLENGFKVQDYLIDSTWKRLLQTEFQKQYFQEINQFLEKEYQKGIVRPPKELIFNAFNSTKIDDVCSNIYI